MTSLSNRALLLKFAFLTCSDYYNFKDLNFSSQLSVLLKKVGLHSEKELETLCESKGGVFAHLGPVVALQPTVSYDDSNCLVYEFSLALAPTLLLSESVAPFGRVKYYLNPEGADSLDVQFHTEYTSVKGFEDIQKFVMEDSDDFDVKKSYLALAQSSLLRICYDPQSSNIGSFLDVKLDDSSLSHTEDFVSGKALAVIGGLDYSLEFGCRKQDWALALKLNSQSAQLVMDLLAHALQTPEATAKTKSLFERTQSQPDEIVLPAISYFAGLSPEILGESLTEPGFLVSKLMYAHLANALIGSIRPHLVRSKGVHQPKIIGSPILS